MSKRLVLIVCALLLLPLLVHAQATYPEHQEVKVSAEDGLILVGDYFAPTNPSDEGAPAVLFLHPHGGSRVLAAYLAQPLLDAGYALLTVDLRGHGDTGGEEAWEAVAGDLQVWMDWLQSQPGIRPTGVSVVGVGVGANFALVACANDVDCPTAVGISALAAGCDMVSCAEELSQGQITAEELAYIDTTTTTALHDGLKRRSALLISSQRYLSTDSVKYLVSISQGEVQAYFFSGSISNFDFLTVSKRDQVLGLIIDWLNRNS